MERLREFLAEDAPDGDVTSEALIPSDATARASITSGAEGILAGAEEAAWLFQDGGLEVELEMQDGDSVSKDDIVMWVVGDLRQIMLRERTCLNIMMLMSGTATETSRVLKSCRSMNPTVTVAATRKTFPGLRWLQKKAVALGGGEPHRETLSHHVFVKDNHIQAAGGMASALTALKGHRDGPVEVEAETHEDAMIAARWGADVILLDNMDPAESRNCYNSIKEISPDTKVEVSGGIGPEEAPLYANSADRISMGHLTHSAPSLQFSLHIH